MLAVSLQTTWGLSYHLDFNRNVINIHFANLKISSQRLHYIRANIIIWLLKGICVCELYPNLSYLMFMLTFVLFHGNGA